MEHTIHSNHTHVHSANCGHTKIKHGNHIDFVHRGHLHSIHDSHVDECVLEANEVNPSSCAATDCECDHADCGHEAIPHDDHIDFLVNGRIHHRHGEHCDDHGPVTVM
ncbi:MAG: hypothetical protein IPK58_13465 [Acidobacteria bacterium]|nr:hypothetical protein [Acidobacteriota bacterium]